ncbi:hypothetical protein E2R36_04070 [Rathayibacter toxicus]|nr:hypothetical protein E2R36_04070 [Rathayibacter toxicus]
MNSNAGEPPPPPHVFPDVLSPTTTTPSTEQHSGNELILMTKQEKAHQKYISRDEKPARLLVPLYRLPDRISSIAEGRKIRAEDIEDGSLKKFSEHVPTFRDLLFYGLANVHQVFVTKSNGIIRSACVINCEAPGEVGPIFFRENTPLPQIEEAVATCLYALRDNGHKYAVTSEYLPLEVHKISTSIEAVRGLSPRQRDWESPWADIYFPLTDRMPLSRREVEVAGHLLEVRTPRPSERLDIIENIAKEWGRGWASEMEAALSHDPYTAVVAISKNRARGEKFHLYAFIAYNVTAPGFASTTAIDRSVQGVGMKLVDALFQRALDELAYRGHRFAILGGISRRIALLRASPDCFTIPGSYPGVFQGEVPVLG